MSSPFKSQAKKNRKGALDLALTDAIEQASKLQQGKKLPVGKKVVGGQLAARVMMPATAAQVRQIKEALEEEWQALEPRLVDKIGKILGKEVRKI
jgi:hypothetical protein